MQLSRLPPRYPHNIAYFSQFLQGKAANCSASLLPRERVATPASSSQPDCLPAKPAMDDRYSAAEREAFELDEYVRWPSIHSPVCHPQSRLSASAACFRQSFHHHPAATTVA